METIKKLAKAHLMLNAEYSEGDFYLKFNRFWCVNEKDAGTKNVVIAEFDVYDSVTDKIEGRNQFELFTFGFVTPKGYKSTKTIPVEINDTENITRAEIDELRKFKSQYKLNKFDPFWHQHEAESRNAHAMNTIARDYITDPWCTR